MDGVRPVKSGWYNAFRPWTLHGAAVPVALGGAAAFCGGYMDGWLDWAMLALAMAGGCLLQSAANLLNTYGDYARGLDTVENHSRSPELVSGTLEPKRVELAGLACIGATALIGLVFIWRCGPGILAFGLAGIFAAAMYTMGAAYKYAGFGQLSVFVSMGLLMPAGTYYVLAGGLSAGLLAASFPNALLITAVLGGNELRDFEGDSAAGLKTLSIRLGYRRAMLLYRSMCTLPFVLVPALVVAGVLPWPSLLALLALPMWRRVLRNSASARDDPRSGFMLVPLAFKLNWVFGALLVAGYIAGNCLM